MKNILLYIWQLPQHLLALIIWAVLRIAGCVVAVEKFPNQITLIGLCKLKIGLSLGRYIFLHELYSQTVFNHECGHTFQSRQYGPLYLFNVGIPSITRNIWQRLFHKSWAPAKRIDWYYGSWPENDADKRGGVERK